MAERRMISTSIYDSSVAWNLGQKNPGLKGLAAQRILEMLIFLADDHGRGRYIPGMIRSRGFSSTAKLLDKVSVEDVETWLRQIEEEGTIKTYTVNDQKYYTLSGWQHYQRGNWRPGRSHIPPPPWEEAEEESKSLAGAVRDKSHKKSQIKSTDKSQGKSTKKSAVEVDEEVDTEDVAEKKRREEKGKEEKQANDGSEPESDHQAPASIGDMLRDPDVPDSEAVAAGCGDLPDPEPYGATQFRRIEQGDEPTPGLNRKEQEE